MCDSKLFPNFASLFSYRGVAQLVQSAAVTLRRSSVRTRSSLLTNHGSIASRSAAFFIFSPHIKLSDNG